MTTTTGLACVVGVICGLAASALAQPRPEAEKFFRDGKQLMKDGKLAEACSAFEASEKVEHSLATLMNLADCREKNQQFASAWALFVQADSLTRSDASKAAAALNATAKSRAALIEPKLSYLTINVPDESRVGDLLVSRDGTAIDRTEWNRSIPIDGGTHEITGKAPGHESWSTKITVAPEGDKKSVEVPKFKELPKLVAPQLRDNAVTATGAPPPAPSMITKRRKIAIGVAAGGVVLAGVGIGFGLEARNLRNEALATCPSTSCSAGGAADANAINDRAQDRALIANVGFAVGGAAVVAGAVLWFLGGPAAPESRTIAVSPQVGGARGLLVSGRF